MQNLRLMTDRHGLTLPSVEQPHIFEDPPKSIHTRKYEPVEIGDTLHLVRDCPDRISEHISKFPHAETFAIGSGEDQRRTTNSTMYGQWGSPYVVNKAFRPPMVRPTYDLLPLSRMQRPNTSAHAYAHVPYNTRIDMMKAIDFSKLKTSVWALPRPDQTFVLGDIHDRPNVASYISDILLENSVMANPTTLPMITHDSRHTIDLDGGKIYIPVTTSKTPQFQVTDVNRDATHLTKDIPLINVLRPGFEIALYDDTTRRFEILSLKPNEKTIIAHDTDKRMPITIPMRGSTEKIKLKEYNFFILEAG